MNRRTQYKLRQLLVIMACWIMTGAVIAIYEYFVLQTNSGLGLAPHYSLLRSVILNMSIGFFAALTGGSILVFYVNVKFTDKPYGYTILIVAGSFLGIIILINELLGLFAMGDIKRFQKNGIVWSVVVSITQLLLQINSKFGQGIFWNIISGKYNTPKVELKIFMFLDLNSSTTIAEDLGDQKYHELLKDLFIDITNPIIDNRGEIYQYVGDEVVIAWHYKDGISNSSCIKCFFDIKAQLHALSQKYNEKYGFLPTFKAGIHCGKVIAGEVGIIKRDITYSGDVLNTTSRIQSMCKTFNHEVIVSSDLFEELQLASFNTVRLGAIKLRGKEKEISLVGVKAIN
ncbi:adenylate/guanylate cyclase domain-containing protein [Pedobacter chinensis]|uniref:Adenylate/guanylate cyclase domain-containing protein n=1 Tax=Pedobacter chinensis TaxID=2282421 RepID=A0A369PQ31_9SPHI|nr:adenylate/guanylate cyclase domain-containing protein [Pedobacter chinensis]RDC54400.1 adenylate/guanylate cyclase domain-containing protein [Pedobacter chinensis]